MAAYLPASTFCTRWGERVRHWSAALAIIAAAGLALAPAAHAKKNVGQYAERDLVSNVPFAAELLDPDLVNAWGLAFAPTSPAWVADNGTGVSTLYSGSASVVVKVPLTVSIPDGAPTGAVFNGITSTGLLITDGVNTRSALFLFASESGKISGWNPTVAAVPPDTSTTAVTAYSDPDGAIFKGLALANTASGPRLYATDFHNGRVLVLDDTFHPVTTLPSGAFSDPKIPAKFAPFGIELLGGNLYVSYAKQDKAAEDDVAGKGNGFVDVYDLDGTLLRRFAAAGPLNSPWGMALAPAGFGAASGALLIGNFGDGLINAYDPTSGDFLGSLGAEGGKKLTIDGLWALKFSTATLAPLGTLLFTAGPAGETQGLFGSLTAVPGA
jgi:uncharacterized protein (TIGR03118 family)